MTEIATYKSPLGNIEVECDGAAVIALRFVAASSRTSESGSATMKETFRWLDTYFASRNPERVPPLRPQGTPFQQRVWRELLEIPYGCTATYGDIARRVGCRSAQAVGQAIGRNPIAIIIPCHRVVGADGSLTGYAYGIETKEKLLQLEQAKSK